MHGKLLIGIILILLTLGGSSHSQSSDLGLSVSPQIFELDVFAGQIIEKKINLKNLSSVPIPILVKTTDFTAHDYSGEMEFDESLNDPIIASRKWFEIENPNFIMDAGEKKELSFAISVPQNAEPGGHYSVVLFEPQLPSYYFEEGQPKTIPVIGVLFMISVQNLNLEPVIIEKKIEIAEFKIPEKEKILNFLGRIISAAQASDITIVENKPSEFFLAVKNNDIYHHKISGKILIYNSLGKIAGESEIKKTTVLPGKIRQFPVNISSDAPKFLKFLPAAVSSFISRNTSIGKYRVVLDLAGENDNVELNQSMTFWAFPWKIIIIFIVLAILIFLLRKRVGLATKIIFKRRF